MPASSVWSSKLSNRVECNIKVKEFLLKKNSQNIIECVVEKT